MMIIHHFLNDNNFTKIKRDFGFLIQYVKDSHGELELGLRENYFNIYYKGNSLAKITFRSNDLYDIRIHQKFFSDTPSDKDPRFPNKKKGKDYVDITIENCLLHSFLQKSQINELCKNIKGTNNGEEITFEQMIVTDNMGRRDLIIIDRQVRDKKNAKRIDLLSLKQVKDNQYKFLVIEVKMGNNDELKGAVEQQLSAYISRIEDDFKDYKLCYERNYAQKKTLGLFTQPYEEIEVISGVEGLVLVGGYSGLAEERLAILRKNYPNLPIKQIKNEI